MSDHQIVHALIMYAFFVVFNTLCMVMRFVLLVTNTCCCTIFVLLVYLYIGRFVLQTPVAVPATAVVLLVLLI